VAATSPRCCRPSVTPGTPSSAIDLGGRLHVQGGDVVRHDSIPPIDLREPSQVTPDGGVVRAKHPRLGLLIDRQENVRASALQDALVAAAVGNGGIEMTPHLMSFITAPDGKILERYKDSVWKTPLTPTQAQVIVPLMEKVVTEGTASGVGFPASTTWPPRPVPPRRATR